MRPWLLPRVSCQGASAPVDGPEVVEDGLLVVLDGAEHIVGAALEQAARSLQLEHEELLGLAVVAPARRASGLAGVAAREAQRAPVRRAVAGPGKARGVDERLGQQHRVSMHRLHVLTQPPQAQPQHPRGQVRHPARRHDDEARVVGDQMQAPELLLRRPADPTVARGQLERAGLPADQRDPTLAMYRDMAQALAEHAVKRKVMMAHHQPVPAPVFLCTPSQAHRDRAQINGTILGRHRHHDRHTATSQTKSSAPRSVHPHQGADKKLALPGRHRHSPSSERRGIVRGLDTHTGASPDEGSRR